ncbi:hypothetical protein J0S82_008396 [Galemys pyrenaicus]|uniref:DUF4592 domain-containing protein n=1 Tax=Galemys pyrenaicus TaxID=202257 RepID=A0A8J6A404_GALPY|nr:hypothetical protein J0S82_008396 [Galemys pyrenaicus]
MISTRVMDIKLREAAEGLGEDSTGKKKSKFKTFKKFFGKKKRKESPSSTESSSWKQSQAKSEVIPIEAGPVGYDSEDELEESRGALGSRALSHDSIFIPESGQDPARPVRVFSQENVCDRIKALQLKIQCNVKMGPPPPPGALPAKRGDDTGMSSEDDGLPRSPPEMSLLHDVRAGTTIKVSLVSSSRLLSPNQQIFRQASEASVSLRTLDSSMAPLADFDYPPEFSSCLDNSAAKHKLLVKPRNQRSSKMRRLSSRAQSESLSDLTCTPEEEDYDEKPSLQASAEKPSSGQQEVVLERGPAPGEAVTTLLPVGPRARRARLQHCRALSASAEEEGTLGDSPSSRPATPETAEPADPCSESPSLPEGPLHPHPDSKIQREELSLETTCFAAGDTVNEGACASGDVESQSSPCIPEGDTTPPETGSATTLESSCSSDMPDQNVQKEEELTLEVPSPEETEKESSVTPARSPAVPKSCLKHRAMAVTVSLSTSPTPPTSESPTEEPSPCPLDKEATPPESPKDEQTESPKTEQVEAPQEGPERVSPEPKMEREASELRSVKKFSVSSGRGWPHTGSAHLLEHSGPSAVRLPLVRSSLAWRSEAALDDLRVLPESRDRKPAPQKPPSPAECGSQNAGDKVASQPGPARSPRDAVSTPGSRDPCPAVQEPPPCEDRNPFPVKLRSTSLSFKHRDVSSPEVKGVKRYSAEVRLEKGGLTLLSKDEKCQIRTAPATRGARSPNDQRKGKARPSEPHSSKPPLPRKPLLQALTLPHMPTPPDISSEEPPEKVMLPDPRKESRTAEKKSPHRGTGKTWGHGGWSRKGQDVGKSESLDSAAGHPPVAWKWKEKVRIPLGTTNTFD